MRTNRSLVTLSLLSLTLVACNSLDRSTPTKILFGSDELVMAYTKEWFYQGPLPSSWAFRNDEHSSALNRRVSNDENCWDFGEYAWISSSTADHVCGVFKFTVVKQEDDTTFWADVSTIEEKDQGLPYGRIYVEKGLLECYRFNLLNGSHFDYSTRVTQRGCDWE